MVAAVDVIAVLGLVLALAALWVAILAFRGQHPRRQARRQREQDGLASLLSTIREAKLAVMTAKAGLRDGDATPKLAKVLLAQALMDVWGKWQSVRAHVHHRRVHQATDALMATAEPVRRVPVLDATPDEVNATIATLDGGLDEVVAVLTRYLD